MSPNKKKIIEINFSSVLFQICLKTNLRETDLVIVLFVDQSSTEEFQTVIKYLQNKYNKNPIKEIHLKGNFSRGVALDTASRSELISLNDILFFIDVDMIFSEETLFRVRQHTKQHHQVYLPIVFSQYDPEKISPGIIIPESVTEYEDDSIKKYMKHYKNYQFHANSVITNFNGFFRQFGYGICAIYKSDIINPIIDGFNTDIKGWGLEDVKFLEKLINSNHKQNLAILDIADGKEHTSSINYETVNLKLDIFRAPDTSLVHIFHKINCDKNIDEAQYRMCLGTKANTLGYYKLIENVLFSNKTILNYAQKTIPSEKNVKK